MTEFQVHDLVYYGSLGHGVKFTILDRTESGRWVLKCVESDYQYEGGWPIGRLMLADEVMLQEVYDVDRKIRLVYRNYRGRVSCRHIVPLSLSFGGSEHHPGAQWLMQCYDLDKGEERTYALKDCDFLMTDPEFAAFLGGYEAVEDGPIDIDAVRASYIEWQDRFTPPKDDRR